MKSVCLHFSGSRNKGQENNCCKPLFTFFALFFFAGLFHFVACNSSPPPQDAKTRDFVRQIQGVYEKASEKIPSKLVSRDNSKVDLALADIYAEAQAAGNRLPFGLGVVDEKGRVVAVRTPSPDSPFGVKGKGIDQDYSKYKVFAKALSGGRLSMGRLYIENTSFLVVCGPLRQKGKVVGALGIKMSEDLVRERAGVPVEEFLKININF